MMAHDVFAPFRIHARSASLEEDAFDELWNDRGNLELNVPFLSGNPGMHGHILHRELNLDRQTPKLHHLAQPEPDGDRPDVFRRCGPVRKDVTRVTDTPTVTKEERGDRLQIHLVRVWPAMLPADGSIVGEKLR
jgi:hypothetical protein